MTIEVFHIIITINEIIPIGNGSCIMETLDDILPLGAIRTDTSIMCIRFNMSAFVFMLCIRCLSDVGRQRTASL